MQVRLENVVVQIPNADARPSASLYSPLFSIGQLEIAAGERVLVRGPSGKGKTTLLHLIAGLFAPNSGRVLLDGQDLAAMSDTDRSRLRREKVSIVFQKLNLLAHLTALENVEVSNIDSTAAERALKRLGLADRMAVAASQLSLGEQQRVAVARVTAAQPALVLADEPTSSLDDANADSVRKALLEIPGRSTLIVVSHDHRLDKHFSRVIDFDRLVAGDK